MKAMKANKTGPRKSGPVRTSQMQLTKATPKRAEKQSSVIAGGYPTNFGIGGSGRRKSTPKPKRRGGMY